MSDDLDEKGPGVLKSLLHGALVPMATDLSCDPERLVQEIQMLNHLDIAVNGIIRFERGRRLNELWPLLQSPEYPTFTEFIAKKFPEMHREAAYVEMRFAHEAKKLPNFRGLANMKGGWGKIRLMFQEGSPEEYEEYDKTGKFKGLTVADKSTEEMKRELKKANTEKEELAQKNASLKDKVDELTTALATPDLEAAKKLIKAASAKVHDALQLLRKVDLDLVSRDWVVRLAVLQATNLIGSMAGAIEHDILSRETPEPPAKEGA